MKKKVLSALLISAMVTGMVAGCGSDGGASSSGSNGGTEATAEGGHTLTVWAWDANFNIPALEAAAADYKENVDSEFELNIEEQGSSDDVQDAFTLAGSSGSYTDLPDITLFQDHSFKTYQALYPDAFLDVADASDMNWDDFGAEKLDYSTIDGTHYGFPVDNGTVIMAYRTDLLEQAGYTVDDMTGISWDDFITVGEKVYNETGKYLLCMDGNGNDLFYMMAQAEGVSQFENGEPNIAKNDTIKKIMEIQKEMLDKNVLYLANDWSDYTDQAIMGDQVAGVMNGNWIIPTIEQVEANSGKWEITTMPTINGGEGYASNGGSSLYITGNCKNKKLAEDFLTYTFGGSTVTYDAALKNGGVITCSATAGNSDVYNEGVPFFNDQAIYAKIVEMGSHVQVVEQNDYHYSCRTYLSTAIVNIKDGADVQAELDSAEEQLRLEMGL